MNAVEHVIERLVKAVEDQRKLLDRLLADYAEDMAKRDLRVQDAKDRALAPAEARAYAFLRAELQSERPAALLGAMLRIDETEDGYEVLSSNGVTRYQLDSGGGICSCPRFSNTGQSCIHLEALDLYSRIRYKHGGPGHVDVTFEKENV